MPATTAPPGRVYQFGPKTDPHEFLKWCRGVYSIQEGKPALWARVNPADVGRFADLWPGCVVAEDAQLKGTIRLGRDSA